MPALSVILCAHQPHAGRLARTFAGLAAQTLPASEWEFILVDNASVPPLAPDLSWHPGARIIRETTPGLTPARLAGIRAATGDILVFVDDDNVLDPGHLSAVRQEFSSRPRLGAAGGPVVAEFASPPPDWTREFWGLLALHDHGAQPRIAAGEADAAWPDFAPVGAGLCVRRSAVQLYVSALANDPARRGLDRTGRSLASGGDNDLVFTLLRGGWDVGYFPALRLIHLIPESRLDPTYLARLNEGIQRTWVRVLATHGQILWPPIAPWSVPLRIARAWFRSRAWQSPAAHIRWRGQAGRFRGQADLSSMIPAS